MNEPRGAVGTSLPLAGRVQAAGQSGDACANGNVAVVSKGARVQDAGWLRAVRQARLLAWASLAWMCAEGAVGLWQGFASGSIALTGWALGSAVEGLASIIVIWRFTGSRTLSGTAERRAQRAVAISFWLLARPGHTYDVSSPTTKINNPLNLSRVSSLTTINPAEAAQYL